MSGRGRERTRLLRRMALVAGVLILLALILLLGGHLVFGLLFAAAAAVAVWVYAQARRVR